MTIIRLLADDLTGALDTAAEFVPVAGDMPVFWPGGWPVGLEGSAGLDSGTRERHAAAAVTEVGGLVRLLDASDIAFKKIDSLLRGPTLAEITACMRTGVWRHCVMAPAFPYQGRVTRGGRQFARTAEGWTAVSGDLVADLLCLDVPARPGRAHSALPPGISVFDAETDEDLQLIVARALRCPEPVFWVGTGGLAQALAGGVPHVAGPPLPRPILGLFGSDQPATAHQLAACQPHWLEVVDGALHDVPARLKEAGLALVSFQLPSGTMRAPAAERIAGWIADAVDRVDPPGTVVVAGGETLRSLCDATGATTLLVQGRLVPGVPRSMLQGGRWNGVTVVSKSGAFGHPALLRELILERTDK
ncbi:MAG TPA: four-carbon acid sugar kinase family protein [Rhodopila sp.]